MSNKISCIIVEDELIYQKTLANLVRKVDYLKLIGVYNSPLEAKDKVSMSKIDIAFLDIMTPGESGLEFAYSLQNSNCKIIFTTSKTEFAIHAYDLEAVDYLVKPIDLLRFQKAVDKANEQIKNEDNIQISKLKDIAPENILYFDKHDGRIAIHHKNGTFYLKNSLKGAILAMNDNRFVRTHKSFGVNVQAVTKVLKNKLFIDEKSLPLSRQGKIELMKQMEVF